MKTYRKVGLGLLTLLPGLALAANLIYVFPIVAPIMAGPGAIKVADWNKMIDTLAPNPTMAIVTLLLIYVPIVFYLANVFVNTRVIQSGRALWVVLLLFGWPIAHFIYWYLYFWRPDSANPNSTPSSAT